MTELDGFAVVPPEKGDGFVELSRSKTGRVFRKQILHYGDLIYPGVKGGKVTVDEAFADTLITNFSNKVADIVQIPKAGPNNEHTEDPDRNVGEVIAITKGPKGVYADLDIRTDDADKIGKTLLGASAMMHLNYTDTRTGQRVGPTLLHTAITNRPYVTELEDFEEIVAASASGADITSQLVVLTSAADHKETQMPLTLDELLAELKTDHDIDVAALQADAAQKETAMALSNKIQEELVGTGLLKLSNTDETVDADTLIGAVAEAGNRIVELSNKVDSLVEEGAKKEAASEVEKLVLSGHILPAKKDAMTKLRLDNPDLFAELVPEKPVVKLSVESGQEPTDESHAQTVADEIARLSQVGAPESFVRS